MQATEQLAIESAINDGLDAIRAESERLYMAIKYHQTTGGHPLTFHDRLWLLPIYQDTADHIVVAKCVQVCMTEFMICDMFTLAKNGKRGMYLLPDDDWVAKWVADRVDGLLDRVPYYKANVGRASKESDSRRLKSIFGKTWKFAGTHATTSGEHKNPKHAFEFQADALIIDEYGEHKQANLAIFYDRLASVKHPITRLLGNPTFDGAGISLEVKKTDDKKWQVGCHCDTGQELDWYKNFVHQPAHGAYAACDPAFDLSQPSQQDLRPVCVQCGDPFDRTGPGHWRKGNPDGRGSGYNISRMFVKVRDNDMRELYEKFQAAKFNPSAMQKVHNQWLGTTYENKEEKITEGTLRQCVLPTESGDSTIYPLSDSTRCTAGIDQGKMFHIQISSVHNDVRHKRWIGKVQTWDEVRSILKAHNVISAVFDAQGGGYNEVRDFVQSFEGAWMCFYRPKDQIKGTWELKHKEGVVIANRTEIIDMMVQGYKQQQVAIPPDWETVCDGEFKKHMLNPNRILDAQGRPIWVGTEDHLFHADVYDLLAKLASGMSNSVYEGEESWIA